MGEEYPPSMMPKTKRDPLLVEREKTHGSFASNAMRFKNLCDAIPAHNEFNPQQHLAMTMIMLKIARATANPRVKDHWDDIAGYAKLGSEACD